MFVSIIMGGDSGSRKRSTIAYTSLMMIMSIMMIVILMSQQEYNTCNAQTTCFGFTNSSGFECVHQLGSCISDNTCYFSPTTSIIGMGLNTNSQLGIPGLNYTNYPVRVSSSFNRIFYISKMTTTNSLVTDYNGDVMISSSQSQQFISASSVLTNLTTMKSVGDFPIAILGDDSTTALITTTNKIYVFGEEKNNNLGRENFIDTTVSSPVALDYQNVVDASISKLGGCAIHSVNGVDFNITTWGPAAKAMHGPTYAAFSYVATNSENSRPFVKCDVIAAKNANGDDVPAIFAMDDLGNLYSTGARSNLEGAIPSSKFACDFGECFNIQKILTNVDSFKCSATHCVAVINGTDVYGWGNSTNGQLGNNNYLTTPTKIRGFTTETIIQVTATKNNIYALTESGFIYGMGSNEKGQLGRSPSALLSRTTLEKIVIPDQRRKIWHMADGPNSEYLLVFTGFKCASQYSGGDCSNPSFTCAGISPNSSTVCGGHGICGDADYCICDSGFTGQFCNTTVTSTCFGKPANLACSNRGSCSGNICYCASPFQGDQCEQFKNDFKYVANFSTLPPSKVNDNFTITNLIITPTLGISIQAYSDIWAYTQLSSQLLYLTGPSYNWQGSQLSFDKNFVNSLKPGYYNLRSESIVNVTNEILIINNTFTFEKVSTSLTNPITLDQTGIIYVSKFANIVVSAVITDPTFDTSRFDYDWYSSSDQANYNTVKSSTNFGSNKITFSKPAADFLPSNLVGTNYTVYFKVTYSRYLADSNPFTTFFTVVVSTKAYAPTITLSRFPLSNYLSTTRATSLSAVLSFTEAIPADLVISYLWTCDKFTVTDATQAAVVIYPAQLIIDTAYQFTLTVTVSYKGDISTYVSTLNIKTPPALPSYNIGTQVLSISPSDGSGVALLTSHNITVSALPVSDARILKYTVRYSFNASDAGSFKDLLSLSATNLKDSAYLPYGSMTLQVYIEDEYGNKLTAGNLGVSTQNIDFSSLANIINTRDLSLNQIETTATTLNSATGQDTKSLRERLSEILLAKLNSQSASTSQAILSISQKPSDITTKASQLLVSGISALGSNLRSIYAAGGEADKIASALTGSLSNIVDNKNITTNETSTDITNSLASISRELSKILLPSQTLSISSNNFNILVFGSSSTKSSNYTVEGSSIGTPDNFDEYLSSATSSLNSATKAYGVELVYYKSSLFEAVGKASNSTRSSNVLSFVVSASTSFGSESRSTVSIKGLTKPLVFTFNVANGSTNGFECKFIDEINNYWSTDGCTTLVLNDNTVQCSCNHATKFSTFRLFTQVVSQEEYLGATGIRIVNVIFGAIYFALAALVFIALIILRNINPVRSRYIGPYVGLIAIMVDSLIISFIQNIVVLSLDKGIANTTADIANIRKISDGFNYFNVILVIPLYLTAFFTFLVQIVRYFIKRHMYEFMSNKVLYNAQIYRAITSKVAFWVTLLSSLAVIMAYYAIWVGLGGGNVFVVSTNTAQQDKERMTFTYITSLSYFGLAWIIAICMVIIACWDLFYMNRHLFTSCCYSQEDLLKKSSSNLGQTRNRVEKLLNMLSRTKKQKVQLGKSAWLTVPQVYYFTDDNLYFRLEIHVFITAFVFLSINYLAGIADISVISVGLTNAGSRLAPQIVSLVSGIFYTFCLIAAFGGVIVVSHLTERRRKQYQKEVAPQSKMDEDELNVVLSDRFGKPLFVEFCQKEFSLENVYFYDAITDFLRSSDSKSDADVKNSISDMFEKYIKTGSDYEVNLPSASKKAFITTYETPQPSTKMVKDMFDNVMISVMYNLKDTYSRFSMTEEYKLYQQSRDNISMLENNFL